MIPKKIQYNLHYNDVRGDFLRPPHGITPATIELNKSKKGLPLETKKTHACVRACVCFLLFLAVVAAYLVERNDFNTFGWKVFKERFMGDELHRSIDFLLNPFV